MQRSPSLKKSRKRVSLWVRGMYSKLCTDLAINPSDRRYVLKRLDHEGPTFLSKTLPLFSKYTLECIEAGKMLTGSACPTHFQHSKEGGPLFMRGDLKLAIAGHAPSLRKIRQLCDYTYKLAVQTPEKETVAAWDGFLVREERISQHSLEWDWTERVRKNAETLYPSLAQLQLHDVFTEVRPFDGPGSFKEATELKKSGMLTDEESSFLWKRLDESTTGVAPSQAKAFAGFFKSRPTLRGRFRTPVVDRTCKITFVPKDSRGPRVISMEPYLTQKGQMAIGAVMAERVCSDTRQRVNFRDQSINQQLARQASLDGLHATLDLKDASDMVSEKLVKRVFRNFPSILLGIHMFRSTHATFSMRLGERPKEGKTFDSIHFDPNSKKWLVSKTIKLRKAFNMGAGMCFPILSTIVHSSAVSGVQFFTMLPARKISNRIYVYGDDVICPTEWFDFVCYGLEKSGLVINKSKSFRKGPFRESCGGDYLAGEDVAPVRLKLTGGQPEYGASALSESASQGKVVASPCASFGENLQSDGTARPTTSSKSKSMTVNSKYSQVLAVSPHGMRESDIDGFLLCAERHTRELARKGLRNLGMYILGCIEQQTGLPLPSIGWDSPYLGRVPGVQRMVSKNGLVHTPLVWTERAYLPLPETQHYTCVSQEKALSRALRSHETPLTELFGDISIPKRVKLLRVYAEASKVYGYGTDWLPSIADSRM